MKKTVKLMLAVLFVVGLMGYAVVFIRLVNIAAEWTPPPSSHVFVGVIAVFMTVWMACVSTMAVLSWRWCRQ